MRLFYIFGFLFIFIVNPAFSQKHPDWVWRQSVGENIEFLPDGKSFAAKISSTKIVSVNIADGKFIDTLYNTFSDTIAIFEYEISADGKYLAILDDRSKVILWNIAQKEAKIIFDEKSTFYVTFDFSPDSKKFVLSNGNAIQAWDIETKTKLQEYKTPNGYNISIIQYIKGTEYLYGEVSLSKAYLWNAQTAEFVKNINRRYYSPNGSLFLEADIENNVFIFNTATEEKLLPSPIKNAKIYSLAVSPEGKYLLYSTRDSIANRTITILWDINLEKEINRYENQFNDIMYLAFTPDSQYIVLATQFYSDVYRFNTPSSVNEQSAQTFHLSATPNPASAQSLITFTLLKESPVKLSVFDAAGSEVLKLFSGQGSFGENRFVWNTEDLPQGTYFIRLEADGRSAQVQCAVVR